MSSPFINRLASAFGISWPTATRASGDDGHVASSATTTTTTTATATATATPADLENLAHPRLGVGRVSPLSDRFTAVGRIKVHYGALALLGTFSLVFFLLGWQSPPEARSEFLGAGAVCLVSFTLSVTAGEALTGLVWILQPLLVVMSLFAITALLQRKTDGGHSLPQPSRPPTYALIKA